VIKTLKNSKSPGVDSISAELIKNVDKKLWEEIHALIELYAHYIRRERNCNVAIIEESAY
jgi:endonuclease III